MKIALFLTLTILTIGCNPEEEITESPVNEITKVQTEEYELIKSSLDSALLIIFPGGGASIEDTKEAFQISEKAPRNGISVLFMNFNRKLWIEDSDSEYLREIIEDLMAENGLNTHKIFIGGMSLGGTVSLSLANYLTTHSNLKPSGVFVVDSPIDLYALYESSQKDLLRTDFSEERLAEPKWIINYFEEEFGGKDSFLLNIQKVSPFTLKTKHTENISALKESQLRFYTEPDTNWLMENRQTDFESSNAFTLQRINDVLKEKNWKDVTLIQTKNKGYRANGARHPHSWSIVGIDDLLKWIMN